MKPNYLTNIPITNIPTPTKNWEKFLTSCSDGNQPPHMIAVGDEMQILDFEHTNVELGSLGLQKTFL